MVILDKFAYDAVANDKPMTTDWLQFTFLISDITPKNCNAFEERKKRVEREAEKGGETGEREKERDS